MASLRSIATINPKKTGRWEQEKQETSAASKDLAYTLVPGETKKNYCKIMINVRIHTGNNPFQINYLKELIQRYAKKRGEHHFKSGQIRTERLPTSMEEATSLINELIGQNYLKYYKTQKRDKLHPNIPEDGIKYYIFDKFRVIECEESKYFRQKLHRKTEQIETKGLLSERRCKALRQIYAQFGDKIPFTYEMVRNIPKYYRKIAEDKTQDLSEDSKIYYRAAAQYSESVSADFLDTWNSLIRNNFILPYKVKTKDGTIKIRQGAYKVNMTFVRQCLSGANL